MGGNNRDSWFAGGFFCRLSFIAGAVACASCARAPARPQSAEIVGRGVLVVRGWSVSELTKGPAVVHVYSQSTGGTVYIATASPGGGGDECAAAHPTGPLAEAKLEPDKRLTVAIREGEVVCLQTQARRTVEVLWHAHKVSPVAPEWRVRPAALATRP